MDQQVTMKDLGLGEALQAFANAAKPVVSVGNPSMEEVLQTHDYRRLAQGFAERIRREHAGMQRPRKLEKRVIEDAPSLKSAPGKFARREFANGSLQAPIEQRLSKRQIREEAPPFAYPVGFD